MVEGYREPARPEARPEQPVHPHPGGQIIACVHCGNPSRVTWAYPRGRAYWSVLHRESGYVLFVTLAEQPDDCGHIAPPCLAPHLLWYCGECKSVFMTELAPPAKTWCAAIDALLWFAVVAFLGWTIFAAVVPLFLE